MQPDNDSPPSSLLPSPPPWIEAVGQLADACERVGRLFGRASRSAPLAPLAQLLEASESERRSWAEALRSAVGPASWRGQLTDPGAGGPPDLRACAAAEEQLLLRYEAMVDVTLPPALRELTASQHTSLAHACAHLRSLTNALSQG